MQRTLLDIHDSDSEEFKKKGMIRIGEILANIILPDLQGTETKTSLEFNFFIGKLKHEVIRQRINDKVDVILMEKVKLAKRLLEKGIKKEDLPELVGFTNEDIPCLQTLLKNQSLQ